MKKLPRLFTLPLAVVALLVAAPTAFGANISSSTANPLADGFDNDAECSLREMVAIANADNTGGIENSCDIDGNLGNDTILLQGGEYALTTAIDGTPGINDGDLEVTDTDGTSIQGTGASATIIDGGGHDRVFDVTAATGALGLTDLTVRDGQVTSAHGGGILSVADVTLNGARVTGNTTLTAGFNGGGIQISGAASVLNMLAGSSVDTNISAGTGGGIDLGGGGSLVTSGGNVQISDNTAGVNGGGVSLGTGSGNIDIGVGTLVEDNTGVAFGGGISSTTGAALTITGATVKDNDVLEGPTGLASGGGIHHVGGVGGLDITDSVIDNNTATGDEASGGGLSINALAGTPSLTRTTVINNDANVEDDNDGAEFDGGGGIRLTGTSLTTITESVIADNLATVIDDQATAGGAGILASGSTLTIERSLVEGNDLSQSAAAARNGAGLRVNNPNGPTRVLNSTFSGNTMEGAGVGGAIAVGPTAEILTVAHSTFTGNNAGFGDAINSGSTITLRGSVIDQGPGFEQACFPDGLGGAGVDGHNVDAGTSCVGAAADTDLRNAGSILLAPLASNGGPTPTHALLAGSPAIDFVPAGECLDLAAVPLTVDQRGFARPEPAGGACDAGAFEVQDTDDDGVLDTADNCPSQSGPGSNGGCPVAASVPPPVAGENPECETLRQRISRLTRKIKRADGGKKAKLKKQRRKARSRFRALGCV